MTPDYIHDEIDRRMRFVGLHRSKAKSIARAVGIDFYSALDPQPTVMQSAEQLLSLLPPGEVDRGAVWFQTEVRSDEHKRQLRCRIVYATTPYDDDDTPSRMVSSCEALVWHDGEPAPEWVSLPEDALPPGKITEVYEKIDELALAQAQRRKPPS